MAKRIVVALGGNALGNSPEEQLKLVKNTAKSIVDMTKEGYEVIVGHGNGPQVGMINLAMDYAANGEVKTPYMPFAEMWCNESRIHWISPSTGNKRRITGSKY